MSLVCDIEGVDSNILDILEQERKHIESAYMTSEGSVTSDPAFLFKDVPLYNIPMDSTCINQITNISGRELNTSKIRDLLGAGRVSNNVLYHRSALMDWHTNSNAKGKRIYLVYNYGNSIFRYIDPETGKMVDSVEPVGRWFMRRFEIPSNGKLWHTIASGDYRISYGFAL